MADIAKIVMLKIYFLEVQKHPAQEEFGCVFDV